MRALLFVERLRLEAVDLPDPEPGPGDVVLRVAACGICGSDLSCYKTGVFAGQVLGHEFAGVIESVGKAVHGWTPGDPVAVDPKTPCGTCADCRAGASHRCPSALTLGLGAKRPGGFAERVVTPSSSLHRLPPGVAVEDASLVEPLSVAIHALDRGGIGGETAVVLGLGPIGLLVVAALRSRGATSIIGVEPVAARRALALSVGATQALAPGDEARAICAGAPVVIECTGRPDMLQEATDLTAAGGRTLLLGIPMEQAMVAPMVWVTRELTIVGSVGSGSEDFRAAIDLIAGNPAVSRIITRRVGLDDAPGAFEELLRPSRDGKIAVVPG